MNDVLPSSHSQRSQPGKQWRGTWWVPIFCASCGKSGGLAPEGAFACRLCDDCSAKYGDMVSAQYVEPDVLFWLKANEAQMERYGRVLNYQELAHALSHPKHPMSRLARERTRLTPKARA